MKKQVISILFAIVLIFSLRSTCDAASANISCDTSATVGKEITISANVTGVMWNLELKVNGETIAKNNELENYASNKTVTFSGKYTPKTEGNLKVTLTGTVTEFSDGSTIREFGSKTINVKAPVVTPPPEQKPETPPTQPPVAEKSKEARLSNLGIRPNDFKGFKRDKLEYSTTVPNNVSEVEIYADPVDKKAKVEGAGKVTLKEGDNKFEIKVTAEDGKTTKVYKLTITRKTAAEEENENGEARLKSLGIKPKEYDFTGFNSEKTEYSVEVPDEVKEIEVYATAMNSSAQITGTGMIELKEGVNDLKIEVIAANGEKKTYTIQVTRTKSDETAGTTEEKFGLKTLSINGITLSPSFNVGIYEYTATLTEDLSSLEIIAKPNTEGSTVEIVGNEELKQGENVITILVSNKITEEVATYQIILNKNVEIKEEIQTSWLKPSTWGKEEKIKIAIILVIIILIIWAIILKIKISKEGNKSKKSVLPGAEELDKAIAEHQELSEEPKYEMEEKNDVMPNYIEEIARNKFSMEDKTEDKFDERPRRKGRHF